jgi:hypothetical protein
MTPPWKVCHSQLEIRGAQSNDGFRMWKNKQEAFEGDGHKVFLRRYEIG